MYTSTSLTHSLSGITNPSSRWWRIRSSHNGDTFQHYDHHDQYGHIAITYTAHHDNIYKIYAATHDIMVTDDTDQKTDEMTKKQKSVSDNSKNFFKEDEFSISFRQEDKRKYRR